MSAQDSIPEVFDVFLCHNSEDKPAVREIAKALRREGIKPWLDEEQIRPGTTWQMVLGEQIRSIRSAAVFVGNGGIGPWQNEEIQAFLNEFIERKCPVIPTILAPVSTIPDLPWTLKNRHHVDFRISDPDPLEQLIWGITGKKPTERESLIPDKNRLSELRTRYSGSRLYPPLAEPPNQENKTQLEILRRRVIEYWVDGVLRHSLYNEVLISLGKRQVDEFVDAPWKYKVELSDAVSSGLLPDRNVTAVYDSAGLLLILGEPGSGKTTTLLDLARTLLERAGKDIRERVAVVLNLSSWKKKQPLAEWISVELSEKYRVPGKIARFWLQHDYLVPLLDGLDEVETSIQPDCVAAINRFVDKSNPSGLVVCCRLSEYRWLPERLTLNGAIRLEPLSEVEVDEYLRTSGAALAALGEAIKTDTTLKEIAETPLMLNVMSLAFKGVGGDELIAHTGNSPEERRNEIFRLYVEQMFQRKGSLIFPKNKTSTWLSLLAEKMRKHSQSEFLVEGLQPTWLRKKGDAVAYTMLVTSSLALLFMPIFGLCFGMMVSPHDGVMALSAGIIGGMSLLSGVGLGSWSVSPLKRAIKSWWLGGSILGLMWGLCHGKPLKWLIPAMIIWGLLLGPIAGAIAGLGVGSLNDILLVENITWKWKQFWKWANFGLLFGITLGLLSMLGTDLSQGVNAEQVVKGTLFSLFLGFLFGRISKRVWKRQILGWLFGLTLGMFLGLDKESIGGFDDAASVVGRAIGAFAAKLFIEAVLGLIFGLALGILGGFTNTVKKGKARPNQGITLSLKNSLIVLLITLLVFSFIGGLIGWRTSAPLEGLRFGLSFGLLVGMIAGLNRGGSAMVKHYALRLTLWRNGFMPLNYVSFLDHCAKLIFLKKVGGGYIFIHRMLLKYFAEMNPRSTKS